jgi:hypothetical protein
MRKRIDESRRRKVRGSRRAEQDGEEVGGRKPMVTLIKTMFVRWRMSVEFGHEM